MRIHKMNIYDRRRPYNQLIVFHNSKEALEIWAKDAQNSFSFMGEGRQRCRINAEDCMVSMTSFEIDECLGEALVSKKVIPLVSKSLDWGE